MTQSAADHPSRALAEFAACLRFDDLPPHVVQRAEELCLDWFGSALAGKGARPEGIAGVMVDEVALRGIVQSQGAFVAMISAPNGRTYTVRQGDRLMDGAVRAINGQSVVMMQEVNDPLSLQKQREVRKQLRGEVK